MIGVRALQWTAAIAVALGLWQIAAAAVDSLFFPPPYDIIANAWDIYLSGNGVSEDVIPSMSRFARGWLLAVGAGALLGLVFGLSPFARAVANPLMQFGRAIPTPLVLGAFLILFGTGDAPKVFLIAFGATWPILFNVADATAAIDPTRVAAGRSLGLSTSALVRRVVLPSVSPQFVAGLKVSLSIGLVLMVITEFVGASDGLGFALIRAQRSFAFDDMWAALWVLSLIGLTLNVALLLAERSAMRWHRAEVEQRRG